MHGPVATIAARNAAGFMVVDKSSVDLQSPSKRQDRDHRSFAYSNHVGYRFEAGVFSVRLTSSYTTTGPPFVSVGLFGQLIIEPFFG